MTTATKEILKRFKSKLEMGMVLRSDEHFMYRQAMAEDNFERYIDHQTTSAKLRRIYNHPLFAVNHMDIIIRQEVAAFRRETIAFSKTQNAMIDKYILYMTHKNYMRPAFVKRHKRNPDSNTHSPAMMLGITTKLHTPKTYFSKAISSDPNDLSPEWQLFYNNDHRYHRVKDLQAS